MKITNVIRRLGLVLPLLLVTAYLGTRHGEWIENAAVEWGYVRDLQGRNYLALNVTAPSGIRVESVTAGGRDLSGSWELVNAPDWYKGLEASPWLAAFTNELSPYLTEPADPRSLYTTGRYTFLYRWKDSGRPLPEEQNLRIRYRNLGTETRGAAVHRPRPVLFPELAATPPAETIVKLAVYLPLRDAAPGPEAWSRYRLSADPPVCRTGPEDWRIPLAPTSGLYLATLTAPDGALLDQVRGWVRQTPAGLGHIYAKDACPPALPGTETAFDAARFFPRLGILLFMFYFTAAAWVVGRAVSRWCRMNLDDGLERLLFSTFLGIILLTHLFFALGIVGLLYRSVLLAFLAAVLLAGLPPSLLIDGARTACRRAVDAVTDKPWRAIPLAVILGMLFYNLCYCFVPAAYPDGSGDITNSYLPNIRDYARTHSFAAPVQNATNGITSQAMDVLRTAAFLFVGEPGVYLTTLVYLLMFLAALYLLARNVFNASGGILLIALVLLLSGSLFAEALHLGKHHVAVLASLMIFLYSVRHSDHDRNFLLPGLCLSFATTQYVHFVVLACAYYGILLVSLAWTDRPARGDLARRYAYSALAFTALGFLFNLKLILEVGTCFPPGMAPPWLSDFFRDLNRDHPAYRYIDNHFIRNFCVHNHLADFGQHVGPSVAGLDIPFLAKNLRLWLTSINWTLDGWPVLLLLPFLKQWDKPRIIFMLLTGVLFLIVAVLFPHAVRLAVIFLYPLAVLQFAALHDFLDRVRSIILSWRPRLPPAVLGLLPAAVVLAFAFTGSTGPSGLVRLRESAAVGTMQNPLSPPRDFALIRRVFAGTVPEYEYLKTIRTDANMKDSRQPFPESDNFDYAMLVRRHVAETDTLLIVPVRFHSHVDRRMTARHALGSVIYREDLGAIMADLKKLGITHLSVMPILYEDYCPFYTPLFEDGTFYRYFQLVLSHKGRRLYRILYDGSGRTPIPSPTSVRGLPFVPMEQPSLPTPAPCR